MTKIDGKKTSKTPSDLIRINNRRLNELELKFRTEGENLEYEKLKEQQLQDNEIISLQSETEEEENPDEDLFINTDIIYKDGFGVPYKKTMTKNYGYFIRKMQTGYYKMYWMSLINSELYIFNDRESDNYIEMHVLTPCTYVSKVKEIV